MDTLAFALAAFLSIVAGLHAYWAFGGLWPGEDESSLARTVIGVDRMDRMPPRPLTLAVATAILAAALWPLMWRSIAPYFLPQGLLWLGMMVLVLVFLGRGIAGYLPFFRKQHSAQPFARLNRHYFSPLCLVIGAGFVALLVNV